MVKDSFTFKALMFIVQQLYVLHVCNEVRFVNDRLVKPSNVLSKISVYIPCEQCSTFPVR